MPANQKSRRNLAKEDVGFVLKHRVAGAGFLLFFGALILPWMLGAPNQTDSHAGTKDMSKLVDVINVDNGDESSIPAKVKSTLASDNQTLEQEKVYISKITPLDKSNNLPDSVKSTDSDVLKDERSDSATSSTDGEETDDTELVNTEPVNTVQQKEPLSNVTQKKTIDVGWVVQVGVFTDKSGADRVVRDLQAKGFKPSTSIVDTNRGKATGSRIWLGPYAQRVDAAKAKTELTNKTGEAGFIRAYP